MWFRLFIKEIVRQLLPVKYFLWFRPIIKEIFRQLLPVKCLFWISTQCKWIHLSPLCGDGHNYVCHGQRLTKFETHSIWTIISISDIKLISILSPMRMRISTQSWELTDAGVKQSPLNYFTTTYRISNKWNLHTHWKKLGQKHQHGVVWESR